MADYPVDENNDDANNLYKQVEKIYKVHHITVPHKKKPVRAPLPDLSKVVDFTRDDQSDDRVEKVSLEYNEQLYEQLMNHLTTTYGKGLEFSSPKQWKIYTIKGYPGFLFISQLFTPKQQLYWMKQCLSVYPEPPNLTNHFPFHGLMNNFWEKVTRNETIDKVNANDLLNKMTWSTLGYQYDWTNRKYHHEKKVDFPDNASTLVRSIACVCGYDQYIPEAAIVNYYNKDKSMGGHKDDAEYAMDKPIVSISYGNDCIFLLGGETKGIAPIPILIHSGDCMIMGGRSRDCFHGVARVLDDTLPDYFDLKNFKPATDNNNDDQSTVPRKHNHGSVQYSEEEYNEYLSFIKYMNSSTRRLNINARQVFKYNDRNEVIDN